MFTHTHGHTETDHLRDTHTQTHTRATRLGLRTISLSDYNRLSYTLLLSRYLGVGGPLVGCSERLCPSNRDPYTTGDEVRVWRALGGILTRRALFMKYKLYLIELSGDKLPTEGTAPKVVEVSSKFASCLHCPNI